MNTSRFNHIIFNYYIITTYHVYVYVYGLQCGNIIINLKHLSQELHFNLQFNSNTMNVNIKSLQMQIDLQAQLLLITII